MRTCTKCKQPMVSAGAVCGRPECSPEKAAKYFESRIPSPRAGENHKIECAQLFGWDSRASIEEPQKSFSCVKDANTRQTLIEDVDRFRRSGEIHTSAGGSSEMAPNTWGHRSVSRTYRWIGKLSNALPASGYGSKVNYSLRTSMIREYIMRKDDEFVKQTLAEQARERATREVSA